MTDGELLAFVGLIVVGGGVILCFILMAWDARHIDDDDEIWNPTSYHIYHKHNKDKNWKE